MEGVGGYFQGKRVSLTNLVANITYVIACLSAHCNVLCCMPAALLLPVCYSPPAHMAAFCAACMPAAHKHSRTCRAVSARTCSATRCQLPTSPWQWFQFLLLPTTTCYCQLLPGHTVNVCCYCCLQGREPVLVGYAAYLLHHQHQAQDPAVAQAWRDALSWLLVPPEDAAMPPPASPTQARLPLGPPHSTTGDTRMSTRHAVVPSSQGISFLVDLVCVGGS